MGKSTNTPSSTWLGGETDTPISPPRCSHQFLPQPASDPSRRHQFYCSFLLLILMVSGHCSHACLQLAPVIEGNARNAGNALLVMALLLLILESCSAGTYALNCKLTVKYRTLQGLCSVNGKTFLDFGDENHEGNATMLCPALYQSLTDISEVMWSLQSGNDALNVTTRSQYYQGEFIDGFWDINTDEQHSIYVYPLNKTWRESHSDNSSAMEQWKNKNLEKDIRNVLMVDFSCCLNKSSPHFREMPR
ncbi:histocompatibility antigen 60c isoform X3 [Mus musculus]|uniref:histocompatibility antigen 60c isoform X3 n=1 Tax=Mus musculus TaxID=10090 RepID=UPI0003D74963|nr:histocompatibility antigen 60c isoform X3 [Mus musculus]|eukprot:XP_006512550.3 PREDICTED: histocompatibility antigen 60c isoform X3 [Mus musculus]